MSQRGHAPRHGGPAMAGEKAKNFKGSSKRLLKYLRPFWVPVIFVMLFAAASTVFSIGAASTGSAPGSPTPRALSWPG